MKEPLVKEEFKISLKKQYEALGNLMENQNISIVWSSIKDG